MTTPPPEKPRLRQLNVRLPEDLIEQINLRRQRSDLKQGEWVERALRFALVHGPQPPKRRTRPPGIR